MKPLLQVSDASLDAKNIKIRMECDFAGRVHFRDSPLQSVAASRFVRMQEFVLRRELVAPTPELQIALFLIMFDGVATKDDLRQALTQLDSIYAWNGSFHLDWYDKIRRLIRRIPSSFTIAALAVPRHQSPSIDMTLVALDKLLRASVRGPRKTYGLDLLLLDAQAWLTQAILDPLVAHCIGAIPMSSLPRSAMARELSGLSLPLPTGAVRSSQSEGLALAFGAYLDPSGADRGSWLVAEIVTICRRNKSLSNERDKQRMLKNCRALARRAIQAGPNSGLILAWIIDLLESGTRTKHRIKAITPAMYVATAAMKLFISFRGKNVEDLSTLEFNKIYREALSGLSSSKARTLASAFSSWHFFLTCWTNVEPLYTSLHKLIPGSPPKANVLWPHEISTCREWIHQEDGDDRFQGQLTLAFEILVAIRIRASELLSLRICNLQFEGDKLKIEVATAAVDGGTKTPAGRRPQFVGDQRLIEMARTWIGHRLKDGAFPNDYVFGDPYHPDRQYQAGRLYVTLNRLTKAVTGDQTLATHVFSHTRISFDWAESVGQPHLADINPIEQLSVGSGHASAATGFAAYFHFPEKWLRNELDVAIAKRLQKWPSIRHHVAVMHDAFRQARSRLLGKSLDATPEMVAFEFIRRAAPVLVVPTAIAPWTMRKPEKPAWIQKRGPLDLQGVLNLIHDCWHGHPPSVIALRSGASESELKEYASIALQVLRDIGEIKNDFRADRETDPVSALGDVLNTAVGKRIDIDRAGQDKVVYLYDYLSAHLGSAGAGSGDADDLLRDGVASWMSCYSKGYLSLELPKLIKGFVQLLDAADFPRHLIVPRGVDDIDAALDTMIENVFRGGDGSIPAGFQIKHRHGRPLAYLTLASTVPTRCKDGSLPNAALGMSGIHAVMFGAAVLRAGIERFGNGTSEDTNKGDSSND